MKNFPPDNSKGAQQRHSSETGFSSSQHAYAHRQGPRIRELASNQIEQLLQQERLTREALVPVRRNSSPVKDICLLCGKLGPPATIC